RNIVDLSPREKAVFAPLVVLVLWMGLYPNSFLLPIRASVDHLVQQASAAIKAQQRAELAIASLSNTVIPAQAGIHPSAVREEDHIARFEFPVLVLLATTGMMVMISANDLITLYLGLEMQSLALYVTASFDRDSVRSTEAGLKYFVLGALASGMLLYGASLVYGFAGTTSFAQLVGLFGGGARPSSGLIIGMVFVAVGLAFKVSAVPFHMWVPDVYEGP